jgi:hypothetical protein
MTPPGQAESGEICLNLSDLGANGKIENKEKKNIILSARLKVKYQVRGLERFARRPDQALMATKEATETTVDRRDRRRLIRRRDTGEEEVESADKPGSV